MPRTAPSFLSEASHSTLLNALVANMKVWMVRCARATGGEVRHDRGVTWVYSPGGDAGILFPPLRAATAARQLDTIVDSYRSLQPRSGVLYWSAEPPSPPDLGARLAARGFDWSFRPHWMALDLSTVHSDQNPPSGLWVGAVDPGEVWDVDDLPYYRPHTVPTLDRLITRRPQRVFHVAAWRDDRPVGHAVLNLTTGKLGVGGIFSVGVSPIARRQGVGSAVMLAACRTARELGCRYLVLNATPDGEHLYRRLGFVSLGLGQTWWLSSQLLQLPSPDQDAIALIEAVGRGDLRTVARSSDQYEPAELQIRLPSGLTLVQLAVTMRQIEMASWLAHHGAPLDPISAWDMGWGERLPSLLEQSHDRVNWRSGTSQRTPLHEAVHRDDVSLVRVLLAAHPDLTIQDATFHSTPLGWAKHLGRVGIATLIEEYRTATGARRGTPER